jgi:hypothetical protein
MSLSGIIRAPFWTSSCLDWTSLSSQVAKRYFSYSNLGVFVFSSIFRTVGFVLLPVLMVACASSPKVATDKSEVIQPRAYTVAYLGNLSVKILNDQNPDATRLASKKELEDKLPSLVKETFEDNEFAMPAGKPEQKAGVVLLNLNIQYDPGNRALRWVGGVFGAGKGTVEGRIEAVDAMTGAVVASHSDTDSIRMGAFGGNFYGNVEDLVENLAEDLAEKLAAKTN